MSNLLKLCKSDSIFRKKIQAFKKSIYKCTYLKNEEFYIKNYLKFRKQNN